MSGPESRWVAADKRLVFDELVEKANPSFCPGSSRVKALADRPSRPSVQLPYEAHENTDVLLASRSLEQLFSVASRREGHLRVQAGLAGRRAQSIGCQVEVLVRAASWAAKGTRCQAVRLRARRPRVLASRALAGPSRARAPGSSLPGALPSGPITTSLLPFGRVPMATSHGVSGQSKPAGR